MTNEIKSMLDGLNADAIKEVKTYLSELVKTKKETLKAEKLSADEAKIAEVNDMIEKKILKNDMKIVVLYGSKNEEVVGTIVGVLSTDKASITVNSLDFSGKTDDKGEKRRYIDKSRFVRIAD